MNPTDYDSERNRWQYESSYNLWQDSQYLTTFNYNIDPSQAREMCLKWPSTSEIDAPRSNVDRDEKQRRIITKDNLYATPENYHFTSTQQSEKVYSPPTLTYRTSSPSDWTATSFCRSGEESLSDESSISSGRKVFQRSRGLKRNSIEKKFEKAMAHPVKMIKAEGIMQRMGWQGGALGKFGDGITQPIIPNAAYATKAQGLGHHIHPQPTNKVSRKQETHTSKDFPKFNNEYFRTNVLFTILDFIKNETEIEIVFDKSLFKDERKQIHNIVRKLRGEDARLFNFDSNHQFDLMAEIERCNQFVLSTVSEGEFPDRKLCLYKEATDTMYLVTPDDLKPEEDGDEEKVNDKNPDKTDKLTDQSTLNTKHTGTKTDESINTDKKIDANKKEIKDITEQKGHQVKDKEISDEISNLEVDESNPFLLSITRRLRAHKNDDTKHNIQEIDIQDENIQNKGEKIDENIQDQVQTDKVNDTPSKDIDAIEKDVEKVLDIHKTIKDYFIEFCENDNYQEFRFLGLFDDEEMNHIKNFIHDIRMSIADPTAGNNICSNDIIYDCIANGRIEMKEDYNGHSAIYKKTI